MTPNAYIITIAKQVRTMYGERAAEYTHTEELSEAAETARAMVNGSITPHSLKACNQINWAFETLRAQLNINPEATRSQP